jgi:hypothetical protein
MVHAGTVAPVFGQKRMQAVKRRKQGIKPLDPYFEGRILRTLVGRRISLTIGAVVEKGWRYVRCHARSSISAK